MRNWDTSELDALAREFTAAPLRVIPALVPVAHRAGDNIKRVMKADASGHSHAPNIARTINYDLDTTLTSITVEVGFQKGFRVGGGKYKTPGNLANILAFGSVNNAPVMDITRGLYDELPKFMRWVAQVGSEAI